MSRFCALQISTILTLLLAATTASAEPGGLTGASVEDREATPIRNGVSLGFQAQVVRTTILTGGLGGGLGGLETQNRIDLVPAPTLGFGLGEAWRLEIGLAGSLGSNTSEVGEPVLENNVLTVSPSVQAYRLVPLSAATRLNVGVRAEGALERSNAVVSDMLEGQLIGGDSEGSAISFGAGPLLGFEYVHRGRVGLGLDGSVLLQVRSSRDEVTPSEGETVVTESLTVRTHRYAGLTVRYFF